MSEQQAPRTTDTLREMPKSFWASLVRHGRPVTDRSRSQVVFTNLFLHLHPTRVHVRTLRFDATMALGMITTALFAVLTVTGVLLMVYYKPSVDLAYDSIKDLQFVVPSGRAIRNIHRWSAHLMVAAVILHMCRVFYAGAYRKPREFNWLLGMALFVVTLGLSFTGYLLPWDQLAFWAITVGANIAASPRELTDALGMTAWFDPGGFIKEVLLGASTVGPEALLRFYVLHVMVLPLALAGILGLHFWRIRKDGGLARPGVAPTHAGKGASAAGAAPVAAAQAPSKTYGLMAVVKDRKPATNLDPADTVPSWPYLFRAELLLVVGTVLACLLLGLAFDAPLKELANPSVPENPAKAPWYFLGLQELVSYSAFVGGVLIPTVVVIGLSLIPYIDREKYEPGVYFSGPRGKRVAWHSLIFGGAVATLSVAFPVAFGWLRDWFPSIPQLFIIFLNPGTLLTAAIMGWSIWVQRKTGSTRMAAIALFTCFLVGFAILTYVGTVHRGPNWDFYWTHSSWPVH
jgi:quinol-cytochrome oxidoreductase complex cytochrome b subunit